MSDAAQRRNEFGSLNQGCDAGGILANPMLEAAGRALGDRMTTRNWATVLKLHALLQDSV